jgi:hypothetical protein
MTPETLLMTVVLPGGTPTLEMAAAELGLGTDSLAEEFGVVLVDPDNHVYCVEVFADALGSDGSATAENDAYRGPFANPPIEPA